MASNGHVSLIWDSKSSKRTYITTIREAFLPASLLERAVIKLTEVFTGIFLQSTSVHAYQCFPADWSNTSPAHNCSLSSATEALPLIRNFRRIFTQRHQQWLQLMAIHSLSFILQEAPFILTNAPRCEEFVMGELSQHVLAAPPTAGGLGKMYDLRAWSVLFFPLLLSWIQVLKKKPTWL